MHNLEVVDKVYETNLIFDSYLSEYQNPDFNKKIDFTKESGTFVDLIMKNNINREQLELE
jgi:hypothetical protein